MEGALGQPAQMAENADELTPMMSQYFELTGQYEDCLVLFQVGDFYEAFCDAAETISRLLDITLTAREDSTGRYPMAGVPIDNASSYVAKLLDAGFRVAIADQVQDPSETSGIVDRAVTRIITPGTLTEDELLRTDDNNYVACLTAGYGLALLDVSTGEFLATSAQSLDSIRDELGRFAPTEAIVGPGVDDNLFDADCMVTPVSDDIFESDAARDRISTYFGPPEALLAGEAEIQACGALLAYAEYTRGGEDGHLDYLNHLTRYDPREYLLLDPVALRSLELFEPRAVHAARNATLVGILDETASALGSRKLKAWLRRPLVDSTRIDDRLDAVEELTTALQVREAAHDHLRDVYDIERLIGRVSRGRANARDLRSLKQTLDVVPNLRDLLRDADSEQLQSLHEGLDDLPEIRNLIAQSIREDPPVEITEGRVIKLGYDDDLDQLRDTERSGKEWINALEETERERTGIGSLKVGFNQVHGYYIEVTNPNLEKVPDDYQRRQTLKNSERFYTPDLKEREDEILRAEQRADDLEHELFRDIRDEVAAESARIQAVADTLAALDVLVSLADVAANHGYTRPDIGTDGIHIEGGRHPVVERTEQSFVPNDTHLDATDRFAILTGPNMSGKSTYMRQVALLTILTQVGSFVPAASAEIELVDRIFTRVGASDDIAGGRSTFMVEMTEVADILREATDKSLVLLDEVGRGTSTTDGLAIARAVTEHIHDDIGARTLFATHHHELTAMANRLAGVHNLHFEATQVDDEVVFQHDLSPGAAAASYGVEVAKAAGLPASVVTRSQELLAETDVAEQEPPAVDGDLADLLREVDLANTTPLEAMNVLHRLKNDLD
ncbi:DNA mismatch repair protein MutS [Haladaptatus sp. DYSN1]|uniref:DNA mismatch repair protein MutS n=1 Tax=unclassified Haladaptatus TaxID=2622732 RepID=UPI002405DB8D|nr:DNA mismatch repair protein MutS [Haladaptatus sp. DYSN1]